MSFNGGIIMTALPLVPISDTPEPTTREPIKRGALEAAITTAVKRSSTSCETFVGICIERVARNSPDAANWAVKGIKFGKSEREKCNSALSVIIERLKREFEIADG
jgi:hypothetical protein